MLKQRLIIGPILALSVILIVWLDERLEDWVFPESWQSTLGRTHPPNGLVIFAALLVLTPFAAVELSRIVRATGIATRSWLMVVSALMGLVLSYAVPTQLTTPIDMALAIAIVPTGLICAFVASLLIFSQKKNVEGVAAAAGAVVFAMVYLGLMLGFYLALRRWHSGWWIIGVLAITKMADTGAFFTGKAIGKHRLIPWLSPGKTWEGLVGGVFAAAGTGVFVAWLSRFIPNPDDHVDLWIGVVCGILFAIVGLFGDLAVSLFKRGAKVKDSSKLLAGMGGVLDVIDSPLMVAPVAFWVLMVLA